MPSNVKLLLTENVDSLGIVGDVVNVRVGYARNFLLPRNMATTPTEEALQAVAARRAEAQRQLAELRKQREALVHRLDETEITIQRSCNDQGILYAAVTQQDISKILEENGFPGVKARDVRLSQNIKRVDTYEVHVKFESDLEAHIKLWVVADRKLDLDRHDEKPKTEGGHGAEGQEAATADGGDMAAAAPAEKSERAEKTERAEKKPRAKAEGEAGGKSKGAKADKGGEADTKKGAGGWGTPVSKPDFDLGLKPRRSKR
jgi:large subunit ribosomal protein L9